MSRIIAYLNGSHAIGHKPAQWKRYSPIQLAHIPIQIRNNERLVSNGPKSLEGSYVSRYFLHFSTCFSRKMVPEAKGGGSRLVSKLQRGLHFPRAARICHQRDELQESARRLRSTLCLFFFSSKNGRVFLALRH